MIRILSIIFIKNKWISYRNYNKDFDKYITMKIINKLEINILYMKNGE